MARDPEGCVALVCASCQAPSSVPGLGKTAWSMCLVSLTLKSACDQNQHWGASADIHKEGDLQAHVQAPG